MEQRRFNPDFGMPNTKEEAIAVIKAWGGGGMTFNSNRAHRCYQLLSGEVPEFKREERYVVIKLKDLNATQRSTLTSFLHNYSYPTRKAVVVEADWPEYEKVWDMLAQRVVGGG